MTCYKCGEELPEGVRFCTNCGADMAQAPAAAAEAVEAAVAEVKETAAAVGETVNEAAAEAAGAAGAAQQAYQQAYQQPYQQPYQQQPYQQAYQQPYQQQTYQQPYQGAYAGAAAGAAAAAVQQPAPDKKAQKAAAKAAKKQAENAQSPVVSTGAFFWLSILYTVPVIGFIVMVIMNFAAKNLNLRHFARSYFIKFIIGLVCVLIFGAAAYALRETIAGAFGFTWQDILDAISAVK